MRQPAPHIDAPSFKAALRFARLSQLDEPLRCPQRLLDHAPVGRSDLTRCHPDVFLRSLSIGARKPRQMAKHLLTAGCPVLQTDLGLQGCPDDIRKPFFPSPCANSVRRLVPSARAPNADAAHDIRCRDSFAGRLFLYEPWLATFVADPAAANRAVGDLVEMTKAAKAAANEGNIDEGRWLQGHGWSAVRNDANWPALVDMPTGGPPRRAYARPPGRLQP